MVKKCEIAIMYCNNSCPHFYHKYDDFENIWCDKINQKVSDADVFDIIMFDYKHRSIPDLCPLEDVS